MDMFNPENAQMKAIFESPRTHWLRRALPLRGIGSPFLAAESVSIKNLP
jgi:hypothetical protein